MSSADRIPSIETFVSVADLPSDAAVLWETRTDLTLFSRREWWETVQAAAMPDGTTACFVLCRLAGRPAALFPMQRSSGMSRFVSLTTPYTCLYTPLLAGSLDEADRCAVFRCFGRLCRGCATTRLDSLPAEWPWLDALAAGARKSGLVPLRFDHFGNWHERLDGTGWAGYLAGRPGALRETIRRRLRRADRMPDARLSVYRDSEDLAAGIAAFEAVYARSWKDPEPFPAFNAALMRTMAGQGVLRLGVWSIGAEPVAAQIWLVERGCATVLKLAHDEAFKAHSPGTVLTASMLRLLLDGEGVQAIDFGRGDDAYKRGWVGERRQRVGFVLANPLRLSGLMELARHHLGRLRSAVRRR
jgi:CelD/BcsL family acetyltransferase involved in cellulose biosynthesis